MYVSIFFIVIETLFFACEARFAQVYIAVGLCFLFPVSLSMALSPIPSKLSNMQVFGITLATALAMMPQDRHLDCVELWAGVATISRAASQEGMEAVAMDITRIPGETDRKGPRTENILLKDGFMNALFSVLCLRPGGLLWMAPVCSSFVYMNSSNCKRTKQNPAGDTGYGPVRDGNRMALIAAFLYAIAMLIGAKPIIEQPAGSVMFSFAPLKKVIEIFQGTSTTCARCAFTPGVNYGKRFLKRYKFVGGSWVKPLHTRCTCPKCPGGQQHASMVTIGKKGDVTGKQKALKESQSYPTKLGEFVVHTVLSDQEPAVPCSLSSFSLSSQWKKPQAGGDLEVSNKAKRAKSGDLEVSNKAKRAKSHTSGWKRPVV